MNSIQKPPIWVWVAIFVAALSSLYSLSLRYRVEQRNKAVGIIVEMSAIHEAATNRGISTLEMLKLAKAEGLTGVAMSEERLSDLLSEERISLRMMSRWGGQAGMAVEWGQEDQVAFGLANRFGKKFQTEMVPDSDTVYRVPGANSDALMETSVGLNPTDAKAVRDAGLVLVARHGLQAGATPNSIRGMLERSHKLGATIYLPEGDSTIGPGIFKRDVARELQRLGMGYATPEFAKIVGDAALADEMKESLYRLHAAQAAEVAKMTPTEFVDRYALAFRERNMRLLLVRPMETAFDDPLLGSIQAIKKEIEKEGGVARAPKPFEDSKVPQAVLIIIGLSSAAVLIWVAKTIQTALGWPSWTFQIAVGLAIPLGSFAASPAFSGFSAMLFGMTFPVAAYLILLSRPQINMLRDYVVTSLISLVGGLCIAGILNGLPYFVKTDQVMGVKLIHFFPIIIIGLVMLARQMKPKYLAKTPVYWGTAILVLISLGAFALMMARTGNDSPGAVSGLELKFRAILDTLLYARPRTKEFMLGHPLLIMGLGLLAVHQKSGQQMNARSAWAMALLAGGAIGQTSIVNTLCHLHTPIDIGLARIGIGLVLGGIIGLAIWGVSRRKLSQPSAGV